MTDRGGFREGVAACPFVAFADDRDRRASQPDSRHRCYADDPPAPRAIGHQETFCLTANFAGCPTFIDWAKRQAAQAAPIDATAAAAATGGAHLLEAALEEGAAPSTERDWDAPPSWLSETPSGQLSFGADARGGDDAGPRAGADEDETHDLGLRRAPPEELADRDRVGTDMNDDEVEPAPARLGVGAGAAAIAALGRTDAEPARPGVDDDIAPPAFLADRARRDEGPHGVTRFSDRTPPREQAHYEPPRARSGGAPPRETRRRPDAYPRRRGMPTIPPIVIGLVALIVAALLLFALPSLFSGGVLGPGASGTPGSQPSPTEAASPTAPPSPTPQTYTVKSGDTLTSIAAEFGVTVDEILAANPQITDPDSLQIDDVITIPAAGSGSPSPATSVTPAP